MQTDLQKRDIDDVGNVEIREITADDPNLPPFIHIVKADNYADAVEDMVLSVYKAPVNTAVWLGAINQVTEESKKYAAHWSTINDARSYFLTEIVPDELQGVFNSQALAFQKSSPEFNTSETKEFPEFEKFRAGHEEFFQHMQLFLDAIHQRFKSPKLGLGMDIEPRSHFNNNPRDLHTDPTHSYKKIENIHERTEHNFRFLQTWLNAGTAIADPKDWKTNEKHASQSVIDFADVADSTRKPVIWQVPTFALAMIARHPWYHLASLHGAPLWDHHKPAPNRFLVRADLEIPAPEILA